MLRIVCGTGSIAAYAVAVVGARPDGERASISTALSGGLSCGDAVWVSANGVARRRSSVVLARTRSANRI